MNRDTLRISVLGLGYVGLPVAVEFAKKLPTIGFDINSKRVSELRSGMDRNNEATLEDLKLPNLRLTDDPADLAKANFHIVAVPTPIDDANQPNLEPLRGASELLSAQLKPGDVVVYESTVYPGVTEEFCAPILEKGSGLKCGKDFKVGYSPERINPGDTEHSFSKITKVVSGQDSEALSMIADAYGSVVTAGVFRASSIKVAEAAKVIENTQRDLNIALMNELSIIFDRLEIDTNDVLAAASTKWNFMPFRPGLVGGHCIGVDPYYLTHLAERMNYHPQVILAGRRINDGMGKFVAQNTIKEMIRAGHNVNGSRVTIMGLTFKENCSDLRNSRVLDIVNELRDYGVEIQACDPLANPDEVYSQFGLRLCPLEDLAPANAVVFAVAHSVFSDIRASHLKQFLKGSPVLIDVKGVFPKSQLESHGIRSWRL